MCLHCSSGRLQADHTNVLLLSQSGPASVLSTSSGLHGLLLFMVLFCWTLSPVHQFWVFPSCSCAVLAWTDHLLSLYCIAILCFLSLWVWEKAGCSFLWPVSAGFPCTSSSRFIPVSVTQVLVPATGCAQRLAMYSFLLRQRALYTATSMSVWFCVHVCVCFII